MAKITTIRRQGNRQNKPSVQKIGAASLLDRKRVAAYCRVSTLAEEQELSYEAQQKYYRTMFENNPAYILVKVYGDEGVTGLSSAKRPGFMDMMRDCQNGRIDEIYTKSVSRFARNFAECVEYIRELRKLGIVVHFEKENFTSADENIDMLLSIMAIVAQQESNSISQNITIAHECRNRSGDPIRKAPYGYRRDQNATDGVHRWRICKKEANRVAKMFEWFLAGNSQAEVARMLNAYETEQGGTKKWNGNGVSRMLRNEYYVGDLITNKTYTVDYLTKEQKVNHGEKEQYYLRNHHPGIISREDFAKVYKMLGKELPECMRKADAKEREDEIR